MTLDSKINNTITFSDGTHYDLNLLDGLKGHEVKGSIWSAYNSTQKGGNNNGIFDQSEIDAIKRDLLKSSQNGKIDNQILGNLLANNNPNAATAVKNQFAFLLGEYSLKHEQENIAPRDATRVHIPSVELEQNYYSEKATVQRTELLKNFINGRTAYLEIYKDYVPKDKQKYQIVNNYVQKKYAAQRGGKVDENEVKGITNMVCSLSEKYGVDPEIIAGILNAETGGYVFSDKVMKNPGRQYKGVMQVDKETIECMYADPNAWKTKGKRLTRHQYAVSYDHRHFAADDERINELKKKYPTVDALYQAIQSDVSLGLEVGIMAFKGKLSRAKGYTGKAVSQYCAGQYRVASDTIPARIWPLPKYNSNTGEV